VFVIGYSLITLEHVIKLNKASIALMMAILCWVIEFYSPIESTQAHLGHFSEHVANVSQVVFFLLGALTLVEIMNSYKGFGLILNFIQIQSTFKLIWLIGFMTFFLSSVIDNLTTTVVMVTLLQKLLPRTEERLLIGGAIVIAANAGGAWTPIGDVTTTMLWIGGQLSTLVVMRELFFPSLTCLIVSLLYISWPLRKQQINFHDVQSLQEQPETWGRVIFWLGLSCLVFVPFFKLMTGLPPVMGILFGVAFLWLLTDFIHRKNHNASHLQVPHIMTKVDMTTIFFFLGILLAVDALYSEGILTSLAQWLDQTVGNASIIAIIIGLVSSIIDNVPLVAASIGMYDLSTYPTDSPFWNLIAYCAGTGGSILVIGSAAGVAYMGLEKVNFFWYLRRIGIAAFLGYFAGIGVYWLT
jgi:Na+/H+ antiporter NhaD/arsenite permease-like protein